LGYGHPDKSKSLCTPKVGESIIIYLPLQSGGASKSLCPSKVGEHQNLYAPPKWGSIKIFMPLQSGGSIENITTQILGGITTTTITTKIYSLCIQIN